MTNKHYYIVMCFLLLIGLSACTRNPPIPKYDLFNHSRTLDEFITNFDHAVPGSTITRYDGGQIVSIRFQNKTFNRLYHRMRPVNAKHCNQMSKRIGKRSNYVSINPNKRTQHYDAKGWSSILFNKPENLPIEKQILNKMRFLNRHESILCRDYTDRRIPKTSLMNPYFFIQVYGEFEAGKKNTDRYHLIIYKPEAIRQYFLTGYYQSALKSYHRQLEIDKKTVTSIQVVDAPFELSIYPSTRNKYWLNYRYSNKEGKQPTSYPIDSVKFLKKDDKKYAVAWESAGDLLQLEHKSCVVVNNNRLAVVNPGETCDVRMEVMINNLNLDIADYQIVLDETLYRMKLNMKAN